MRKFKQKSSYCLFIPLWLLENNKSLLSSSQTHQLFSFAMITIPGAYFTHEATRG
jgi:hypothetical protein